MIEFKSNKDFEFQSKKKLKPIQTEKFEANPKWYQSYKDLGYFEFWFVPVTMPPRRQRNVGDVTLHDQMAELRQSNQTLQQMMTENLHQIPTSPTRSRRSHSRSTRSQGTTEEGFDSSSTTGNSALAFDDQWAMERLARALEGTYRTSKFICWGGKKENRKAGSSSGFKCLRYGEAGHRSYECLTKKTEVNLVEEGQEEEEEEHVYDEEPEGEIEK
ncbi:hypothetical protein Acr_08g0014950 [Actinidia rufa]|uniref:Uncharacterized protein n=1 Tax=Actinidia rufa TaxID=165716 RepID=A0A7J0F4C5_9ERIC|nr:hypothetical protein Acr_08g0014950 [Actinidia rufa]